MKDVPLIRYVHAGRLPDGEFSVEAWFQIPQKISEKPDKFEGVADDFEYD